MSNMDVLMSLAESAKTMPVRCMPVFSKAGMEIKNGYHVNLLSIKEDIVPNIIKL
jgi:DNA mismatch repair ATPase MutS